MNILLHTCCAPCLIYPYKILTDKGYSITSYYQNPNIHPYSEYKKRLLTLKEYSERNNIPLIYEKDYNLKEYFRKVIFNEEKRCSICYKLRIKKTAELAKKEHFDAFSTTLLYSVYQNHYLIHNICSFYAKKFNIQYIYNDFRKGWEYGNKKSIEEKMYRQNYCGCIFSEQERFDNRLKKKIKKSRKNQKI